MRQGSQFSKSGALREDPVYENSRGNKSLHLCERIPTCRLVPPLPWVLGFSPKTDPFSVPLFVSTFYPFLFCRRFDSFHSHSVTVSVSPCRPPNPSPSTDREDDLLLHRPSFRVPSGGVPLPLKIGGRPRTPTPSSLDSNPTTSYSVDVLRGEGVGVQCGWRGTRTRILFFPL